MKCDGAKEQIVLKACDELPDELAAELELHLERCEACRAELNLLCGMQGWMEANHPMVEPDANLLAESRMRLDAALDGIPTGSLLYRVRQNALLWMGHVQSAPALATLLVGVGFLGGNFTYRYQVAHAPRVAPAVILTNATGGGVAQISSVKRLPNDMVEVSYDRLVPESAQGSLNDPQIRHLLMTGTEASTTGTVRVDAVSLLASECRTGSGCRGEEDDSGIRAALVTTLRRDRNPGVRMKALEGLEPYISRDQRVRDAVAQALMTDSSTAIRSRAVTMLEPVGGDTSVQQALRTVSTTDVNPYLRTVSTQALEGSAALQ